jgi:hypothetical protein
MTKQEWELSKPVFSDLQETLTLCGRHMVDGIIGCVTTRRKPDGSAQKQNAPSTIAKKGHDHPIFDKIGRFMKQGTYRVEPRDEMSAMISIFSPADSEIAASLEERGYEFFGITDPAADKAYEEMDKYLVRKVNEAFGGEP